MDKNINTINDIECCRNHHLTGSLGILLKKHPSQLGGLSWFHYFYIRLLHFLNYGLGAQCQDS